jgi:serine/threonine protein kinase
MTTPAYMAPEMIDQSASSTKVDMWALGVILYQFFAGKLPFEAANFYDTITLIRKSEPSPLPSTVSPFIKQIISQLLDKNPETRPNAEELLLK